MKFRLFGRCTSPNAGGVNEVSVSSQGEVITRPFSYSEAVFNLLDINDQVYNFQKPIDGFRYVITGIFASANRNVTTQTQVDIYEATAADSGTIAKQIRRLDIAKLDHVEQGGLLLRLAKGVFLNAKCDDDDVLLTIDGYFVPVDV